MRTTAPAATIDLGTDGPAARARPGAMFRAEGEWRGSTRDGAIEAYRYSDTTLYDRMHVRGQLSDAQHEAAEKLHRLYGALPRTTGRYGETAGANDEPDGRTAYRMALRSLPVQQAAPIEAIILAERHPGWALADAQAGLDTLARDWGIG